MQSTQVLLLVIATTFFFFFMKNVIQLTFKQENEDIHRKRMKELNFEGTRIGQSEDEQTKAFLSKVTEPVIRYILPKFKYSNTERLQHDLKFVEWDKFMNATQFRSLDLILKGLGVIAFILASNVHIAFAVVFFLLLFFGLKFFLNNSVTEKKKRIFAGFPEFIRLTQGYLTAEMGLVEAIENTVEFVNEDWEPYLKRFAITARISSVRDALAELQTDIDIFEVRELLSLIRVSLDQGIDVKESFESQTEKVRGMQLEVTMQKIETRKLMGIFLQAPLLLTIIMAFALPTLDAMMKI